MEAEKKHQTKRILLFRETPSSNETYTIWRAILLALSIFYWCFYSLQYGPIQFTILENEQVLPGFVFSRKAVVAFSYGYSTWSCMVSATTTVMLIYSIIWKRPQFSLPLICFFLAEMVHDLCNIIMMIWLVFSNLQLQTALSSTTMLLLIILTKIWMWLGVLQLYEYRTYGSC